MIQKMHRNVRKALEELAVQLACEKITEEEIEEMKKAAEDFKKILKSKDITEIAEADVRFHDIIYMATDNQKLIQLLNNLREQMYRYRVEYLKREEAHPFSVICKDMSGQPRRLKACLQAA